MNVSNEIPRPAIFTRNNRNLTVAQKNGFVDVNLNVGLLAIGFGVLLAILTPLIKKTYAWNQLKEKKNPVFPVKKYINSITKNA